MEGKEREGLVDVVVEVFFEAVFSRRGEGGGAGKVSASFYRSNPATFPRRSRMRAKGKDRRGRRRRDKPVQEIPMLPKLPSHPTPIPIRLRLSSNHDPSERRRIVGKDIAGVEEFLVEELRFVGERGERRSVRKDKRKGGERRTSSSFSLVSKHSFVQVLRKLS